MNIIDKKDFIAALEICKPALGTNNRAIELSHYWFDGETISAYNGHLMICAPINIKIQGGVPHTILDWLKKTKDTLVTINNNDKGLSLSVGRSRYLFSLLDINRRIFKTDIDLIEHTAISISEDFINGLNLVSVSLDAKSTTPEKMGVFLIPNNGNLDIYATDALTLSSYITELPDNYTTTNPIIMPTDFIKQLIKFLPSGGKNCLYITDNLIAARTESILIISNIIDYSILPKFNEVINSFLPPEISIPEELTGALERLTIVDNPIEFIIDEEILYLFSTHQNNRIEEQITLANSNISAIMVKFDPKLILRALSDRTHFSVNTDGMRLTGPYQFTHIIAAVT